MKIYMLFEHVSQLYMCIYYMCVHFVLLMFDELHFVLAYNQNISTFQYC